MQRLCLLVLFSLASLLHNHAALAEPYLIHKDGSMVLDKATGLVWMRCALGQKWDGQTCVGKVGSFTYDQALAATKAFNAAGGLGGVTDWTLPTIRQLVGLRSCSKGFSRRDVGLPDGNDGTAHQCETGSQKPAINPVVFPLFNGHTWFWSASSIAKSPYDDLPDGAKLAWFVHFSAGDVYGYSRDYFSAVRLVRTTQLLKDEAALGFINEAPTAKALWQVAAKQATRARDIAEMATAAAWIELASLGDQAMYQQAGKALQNGGIRLNGSVLTAPEIYEKLIENFPNSDYAIKANDRLNAMYRPEQEQLDAQNASGIYLIHKDGAMVLDKATGLVWMRCALGQKWDGEACVGNAGFFTNEQAEKAYHSFIAAGGLGGASDWVVAGIGTLTSLLSCSNGLSPKTLRGAITEGCVNGSQTPTINSFAFPTKNAPLTFCQSVRVVWDALPDSERWCVNFNEGKVSIGALEFHTKFPDVMRLVRLRNMLGGAAALGFINKAPYANAGWHLPSEETALESKAVTNALKQLIAQGAQAMYLQAGKAQRNGSIKINGVKLPASKIYEKLMEKFPNTEFAFKANEQLNAY